MKKLVLLTLAATVISTSAFAAAVPVTKISDGSTKVQADYAFNQKVSNGGGSNNDGFGVSLEHDLSDKTAVQYSYDKVNADNGDIKNHQFGLVYKVHPNVNLYGAGTAIRTHDTELGVQAGVIGHMPLTDKINGFAKAGWGNDVKQTYQVGAQYELKPNVDLNVYYAYDKFSVDSEEKSSKGLHAGVGYTF
ncbi:porin family protein [Veillonella agrestimuris]|uniref:porin family protein n=1 Tax=Veillonella agrestimuris TaxID=2941340 RepID=UPI00203E3890|nr:porin family protein [Veillonella agrestimuris]